MEIPLKLCIPCSRQNVAFLEGAYPKSKITKDYNRSLSKGEFLSLSFKPERPLKKRGVNQLHIKKRRGT